ncbi:CAP-Gly domain protein [Rhizoctonia solani]|uniref:CAP-Gly domain protein n=1 Tax=Rhizoctonia solani TaxID=456999 RepID=A0A8H8NWA8_9AGAM|nr:CAP-Gly domain protein [Rhizoctonia solani]QRW21286.1 CAP-Gly domain protein [Rhizoctonia solani]
MEAKLTQVAELKEILTKSSTPIPSKANKADLIAKILATPDALKLAGGGEAAAPAPAPAAAAAAEPVAPAAPAPAAEAAANRFDWEGTGAKPDTGASAEAKPAEPASTTESTPAPTKEDASKSTKRKPNEELERRKARAARFGIPLVENPVSTKGAGGAGGRGRKGKKGAEEKEKPASGAAASGAKAEEKKEVAKKPEEKKEKKEEKPKAVKISAKEAAPNDDDAKLAARAARFGISTAPKAAAGGSADPAEDEKRKKREARFGAPLDRATNRLFSFRWIINCRRDRVTNCQYEPHACTRYSYSQTLVHPHTWLTSWHCSERHSRTPTQLDGNKHDDGAERLGGDEHGLARRDQGPRPNTMRKQRTLAPAAQPPLASAEDAPWRARTDHPAWPRHRPPGPRHPRQSNIGRSLSRAGHEFEVGDAVKIESLGMEGTLRFMGEIDGKNGLWAGVELAPAFAGKGKNDGSVAGSLPPWRSIPRPSSAASHYTNGRTTPSVSGRTTPSFAPVKTIPARKYVGVTATDLNSRNTASPTRAASTPLEPPKPVGPCLLHERDQAWLNPAIQPPKQRDLTILCLPHRSLPTLPENAAEHDHPNEPELGWSRR